MNETKRSDFLEQFRQTSSKLKKRFLRKPNATEACDAFTKLAISCENSDMSQYAGLCWAAIAKCENSLNNSNGEMSSFLRAARNFMDVEKRENYLGQQGLSLEHLQAGLGYYNNAISCLPENSPLAIGLMLEMTKLLLKHSKPSVLGEKYILAGVNSSSGYIDIKLQALSLLAVLYVKCGDYVNALNVFTDITTTLESNNLLAYQKNLVLQSEITRIILLLILRPPRQRLPDPHGKLLEKYSWMNSNHSSVEGLGLNEDLCLTLKSLVMACQSLDVAALTEIEAELWPVLSNEQRELLRVLVHQYTY